MEPQAEAVKRAMAVWHEQGVEMKSGKKSLGEHPVKRRSRLFLRWT